MWYSVTLQSYLWNTAASHRIDTFGTSSVVAGDLVLERGAAVPTVQLLAYADSIPERPKCSLRDLTLFASWLHSEKLCWVCSTHSSAQHRVRKAEGLPRGQ